jgi:hypothetical protein
MLEKIKPIHFVVVAVCELLVLVGGIAIGWYSKPDVVRTETQLQVVEVEKQIVVEKEVVRVEIVKVKDTQVVERWHREKTEEKKPDGTVLTKEVEDRNIDSIVKEKENSTEIRVVEVEKQIVVEREKIVTQVSEPVLANWHVGAMVGLAPQFDNLGGSPVMVGAEVERRIVGPIWAGAWVMGGSSTSQFKVVNGSAGIKIGMEF